MFINIKTNEQTIVFLKDQIKKHWPEVVYSQKQTAGVTEIMAYASSAAYKSWEKFGENNMNREKLLVLMLMPSNDTEVLVMVPAHHSSTEKFAWEMKSSAEKRFPSFG